MRPYYLPREFMSTIVIAVYIPPSADAAVACEVISSTAAKLQTDHPDAFMVITGPDGITPRILKTCASQLSPVLGHLYNLSLSQEKVPMLWKTSCLVPVPKKSRPSDPADYRPVALTSHVMKVLERLVLAQLRPQAGHSLSVWAVSCLMWWAVIQELRFTLYTSDFQYNSESCHLQKFSDDSAVVGCIREGEEESPEAECQQDQRDGDRLQEEEDAFTVVVVEVEDFKYLGVVIDNRLDWKSNTEAVYKKGMSRLYFLRKLRSFNTGSRMLEIFYQSVVAS
ncbi:hypothetical protein L3Q82_025503, partial [Scortum barcoo]